jgi:hypothetical protein
MVFICKNNMINKIICFIFGHKYLMGSYSKRYCCERCGKIKEQMKHIQLFTFPKECTECDLFNGYKGLRCCPDIFYRVAIWLHPRCWWKDIIKSKIDSGDMAGIPILKE